MPDSSASLAAAAGLIAVGVGLGGVLMLLGFMGGRAMNDDAPRAVPKAGARRRKQRRIEAEEEEEGLGSPACAHRSSMRPRASIMNDVGGEDILGAGFSMEQARIMAESGKKQAMTRTPAEVLAELQRGNVRFWTGQATRPEKSAFERRALISMQFPSVAILGCADSRVPIEIVFDQGLGDMFVIRVAGNCLDNTTKASLQYAVHHLKVKLMIVMGHEGCGAVKAAQLPEDAIAKEPEALGKLLKSLRRGLDAADLVKVQDSKAADREAVTTNVRAQVEELVRDKGIMQKVNDGELIMLGAIYEISSGIVDYFHEVSGQVEEEPATIPRAPSRGVLSRWSSMQGLKAER